MEARERTCTHALTALLVRHCTPIPYNDRIGVSRRKEERKSEEREREREVVRSLAHASRAIKVLNKIDYI